MNTITVTVKATAPTTESLVLKAIRVEQRPMSIAELSAATGHDLDPMDLFLMIEDGFIYPTDRNRTAYYIKGEESDPDVY